MFSATAMASSATLNSVPTVVRAALSCSLAAVRVSREAWTPATSFPLRAVIRSATAPNMSMSPCSRSLPTKPVATSWLLPVMVAGASVSPRYVPNSS